MTRPSGVRVVHADGTAALCELAATPRIDDNGDPVWAVLTVVDFAAGDRIEIEEMPEHTGLEFPLASDPRQAS